jgi:NAD(P)-dependent dehydrogenase (short-subunit alcohol dehydrogenase family)
LSLVEGKSVVITGTGSGVGRATARLFAQHGANVVCADLRPDWNEDTLRLITEKDGGTAIGVSCDVTRASDVAGAVAVAVDSFGRLDVMFNNAGIASRKRPILLEEHTDEDFDRLVAVNARGVFFGCREAILQFKRQGSGGAIVNTGSIAGLVGLGSAVYGGTKAMIIQMTRALAIEAAPSKVRVNCICPGGMTTNFSLSQEQAWRERRPEELEEARNMHPLGQTITPDDCARAVLYLASEMSANVTGVTLPIDGGYVAR